MYSARFSKAQRLLKEWRRLYKFVSAVSNPRFPLAESEQKRLVKLYLNDAGLLTLLLYELNVNAVLPIEVKSDKDYTQHSALTKFLETPDYGIDRAIVFSNERKVFKKKGVTYLSIYYCMLLQNTQYYEPVILPELEPVG